jgi:adenylate kinase family enzyme
MGAPGVGKSTIYQSLCKTWNPGSKWVYPDVLLTSRPGFFSFRKWLGYQLRVLMDKKLTKAIPVEYGVRFGEQQPELAKFCWKCLTDLQLHHDEDSSKSFRSAYFLFTTFCRYQAIIEKAPAKPCLIEEGFLQKSFFIRNDEDTGELINEQLNKYLQLIPLPYAVIYIDTPEIDEIVKRLRGRNKIIASHFNKDNAALQRDIEKWQYAHNYMLEKLKNAGVLIARVDGRLPVKENVSRINELLLN